MKTNNKDYFLSQPHQPFFILGIANAIIMMLVFALSHKAIFALSINPAIFHIYSFAFLLFSNVFTGFLFTTFPRFNQANVIDKNYYTYTFYASVVASVLFLMGSFISIYLSAFAMLVTLGTQGAIVYKLYEVYKNGYSPDKKDSFWILSASYFGLVGNLMFIFSLFYPVFESIAINTTFYLYLIFLAFSVAQRMVHFSPTLLNKKMKNL
jgi:uncharacterized protein involved in response to NO